MTRSTQLHVKLRRRGTKDKEEKGKQPALVDISGEATDEANAQRTGKFAKKCGRGNHFSQVCLREIRAEGRRQRTL